MRFHGLEIPVTDLDRASDFYANVLGFPFVGRFTTDSALFFLNDVHGGVVNLVTGTQPEGRPGPVLYFGAEEGIDALRDALVARGVRFVGETERVGGSAIARFLDSEGNHLAIYEHILTPQFRDQARGSLTARLSQLEELEARLDGILADVTEEQAFWRSAPGEWPIAGHLSHIVDTLKNCVFLAEELSAGREPPRDRLLEKEYPVESLMGVREELRHAFERARAWEGVHLLEHGEQARLPHGVFGALNSREWVAFMVFHVGMHISQVATVKEQLKRAAG